jgi:hypothetical protein
VRSFGLGIFIGCGLGRDLLESTVSRSDLPLPYLKRQFTEDPKWTCQNSPSAFSHVPSA